MTVSNLETENLMAKTDIAHGLTDSEVLLSRQESGSNSFAALPTKSPLEFLGEAFADPMIRILCVCAVLALVVGVTHGEWVEGVAILCAIVVVASVGVRNQLKAQRDYSALDAQAQAVTARAIRNGAVVELETADLVVGDVLEINTGDVFPADALHARGNDLLVDEKHITGEPDNSKRVGDLVYAGSRVLDGSGRAVVAVVGDSTMLGGIRSKLSAEREPTPLEERLDDLAKKVGRLGMAAAAITALALIVVAAIRGEYVHDGATEAFSFGWNSTTGEMFLFAVTVAFTIIVVAVPEGLPLAVTLALSYTTRRMASEKILVRELPACETMGAGTIICTDKTGTLTIGSMSLAHVVAGGQTHDAGTSVPEDLPGAQRIFEGFAINSTVDLITDAEGESRVLGNATEGGILRWLDRDGTAYREVRDASVVLDRREFTSKRKHMATMVADSDQGAVVYMKGAPEIVLSYCTRVEMHGDTIEALNDTARSDLLRTVKDYASRGYRTLALAYGLGDIETRLNDRADTDLVFQALFVIADPIRAEVPAAVRSCQRAGVRVMMITGDIPETASEIGRQSGIVTSDAYVLDHDTFVSLSDEEIEELLSEGHLEALARALPDDKERMVGILQRRGDVVGMTGDGVNDAPALKAADVGFAMGSGSQVAREASDVVIVDDNFASTVAAIRWGRSVFENLRKFIQFQLTVNVVALSLVFSAAVFGFGTPLTAVQLLWVNLIMDSFAALALALEPPTDRLFEQRPHGRTERLISRQMWMNILVTGGVMFGVLLTILFATDIYSLSEDSDAYRNAFLFNTFVWMQVFNAFNARSIRSNRSPFANLRRSTSFIAVMGIIVISQILIMTFGGSVFSVVDQSLADWAKSVAIGASFLLIGFGVRAVGRLDDRRNQS